MEKCTLKRTSTESSGSSADGCLCPKRPRQERKHDALYATDSQNTLEYQMSDPEAFSQGNNGILPPRHQNGSQKRDHSVTDLGESAVVNDSGSEAGTVVISEDSQDVDEDVSEAAKLTEADTLPISPRLKWKDTSLVRDADTVVGIIPSASEKLIFDTLAKHRADPNRLDIVTATVLDKSSGDVTDSGDRVRDRYQAGPNVGVSDASTSNSGKAEDGQYGDVREVVLKVQAAKPHLQVNAAEVCALLEKYRNRADRIEFVTEVLLQTVERSTQKSNASVSDDIFTQAMKLNAEFPSEDPSAIYDMLEKVEDQANRLHYVRKTLTDRTKGSTGTAGAGPPALAKTDSITSDPLACNDPVYRDMRIISKMFPEKDQNEIYALVEAHYYKPDRVQVVIEELLRAGKWGQGSQSLDISHDGGAGDSKALLSALQPFSNDLQSDVDHLRDVFPDCDPNYIYERLEANKSAVDRVRILASEMLERRNYPRLKDAVEKQTKQAHQQHLQKLNISFEEFLAKFPDPGTTFHDESKVVKESYKAHVAAQLKHDFPDFKQSYIRSVSEKHNFHYMTTVQKLETTMADILANGGHSKKLRQNPRSEPLSYPDEPDEYFFYELWYSKNEQKVKDYFQKKEALQKAKVEAARANNELYECGCCFEDECLFEEMNACADGHLFCRQCIARSAEAAFGEGRTTFPCLTGVCEHQIPLSVLKDVLPSAMFSKVLRKMQEEEVRQAGILDLVDCPFCSFATIMPNPDDHVFRCLNPECLRDSCRLCREPNHVPLKCAEVEKQNETDMRTFIEKRVTEAMIRKCHRCGKHFVKDVGCNKMTCICGATSCYICRTKDIDYEHFSDGRCSEGDMEAVHRREMEEAARKAKEEYLRDHPEAADIDLKYDPLKHIGTGSGHGNVFDYDREDLGEDEDASSLDSDPYSDDSALSKSEELD